MCSLHALLAGHVYDLLAPLMPISYVGSKGSLCTIPRPPFHGQAPRTKPPVLQVTGQSGVHSIAHQTSNVGCGLGVLVQPLPQKDGNQKPAYRSHLAACLGFCSVSSWFLAGWFVASGFWFLPSCFPRPCLAGPAWLRGHLKDSRVAGLLAPPLRPHRARPHFG